jgi:hypothetical protein
MNKLNKEAHALEDINGVRCAVVEKNVTPERTAFLKKLLEENGYTVMVAPSPPPKVVAKPTPPAAAAPPTAAAPPLAPTTAQSTGSATPAAPPTPPPLSAAPPGTDTGTSTGTGTSTPSAPPAATPPVPETFTVGVTDFLFHPMLAIYERALKTPEGKFVTVDYWNQQPEKEDKYYWKRDFFTNSL